MKTIQLNEDDDINSICDRLEWQSERRALLVLPEDGDVLVKGIDLVRLRRFADRLRLDVGLVTGDKEISRRAKGLGLPVFASEEEGLNSRRGWWRGRRRREQVGLLTPAGAAALSVDQPELTAVPSSEGPLISPRQWLFRFVAILLFFAAGAFVVILFSYLLPSATLTLKPKIIPTAATKLVLADPGIQSADLAAGKIPARLLQVEQSWSDEVKTTGSVIVPVSQSRGKVIFVNRRDEVVQIPAGTEISNEDGSVRFQTLTALAMVGVVSSTAEVDVVATLPGPQANVGPSSLVSIVGELGASLAVSNPEAMIGGEVRQVAAVSEQDMNRLRAQILQFLQALALAEMQGLLTEREFLPRDSMRVIEITGETFSHGPGEQTDELRLKLEGVVQATAIDLTNSTGLVYEALTEEVPPGFSLVADGVSYQRGKILAVDDQGRVTFEVEGRGLIAAELELSGEPGLAGLLEQIAGQEPRFALPYLWERLPLREMPVLSTWPSWFQRVPFRTSRIRSEIVLSDE